MFYTMKEKIVPNLVTIEIFGSDRNVNILLESPTSIPTTGISKTHLSRWKWIVIEFFARNIPLTILIRFSFDDFIRCCYNCPKDDLISSSFLFLISFFAMNCGVKYPKLKITIVIKLKLKFLKLDFLNVSYLQRSGYLPLKRKFSFHKGKKENRTVLSNEFEGL